MPATIDPQSFLPGIVKFTSEADGSADPAVFANSTDYFAVPISALPELDFTDVDPVTGDIREMLFAIAVAMYDAYMALPSADRPAKWVPSSSTQSTALGTIRRVYGNTFTVAFTNEHVAPE
jgi:hypothetical protein